MTDLRIKLVQSALLELDARSAYLSDRWAERSDMGAAETLQVGRMGQLTVADSSSGSLGSIQDPTLTALDLSIDQRRGVAVRLGKLASLLTLGGNYRDEIAAPAQQQVRNKRDRLDAEYLAYEIAYDTAGTYHVNHAGDAPVVADVENAVAAITSEASGDSDQGAPYSALEWWVHPYGLGAIKTLQGWAAAVPLSPGDARPALGVAQVGSINGIPVITSQSVPRNRSVACTAVSISSNVATVTVASGHGFVPGMKITIAGITTPLTTAAVITAVTATTLTVPLTASDGAMADGAGTVSSTTCWNMLVRRDRLWKRTPSGLWTVRIVPESATSTDDVLQVEQIWGRASLARGVYVLHTPGSSVS